MNDEERGNELIAPTSSVQPVYGVFDPDYARFFTKARIVAAEEGYALSVHGSFSRDMDMIAVPWTAYASHRTPMNLAAQVEYRTGWKLQSKEPTEREHGRLVWSFLAPETEDPRWIDFSVIPPNDEIGRGDSRCPESTGSKSTTPKYKSWKTKTK